MLELIEEYLPILFNLIILITIIYAIKNKQYLVLVFFLIGLLGFNYQNIINFFENL
jgi:hypothetical protein